jgi:signal transduction histidine kinase/CheY-like chemotaxis protein
MANSNINTETIITMPKQQLQAERIRVLYKQVPSVLLGNILIASLLTFFLYKFTANVVSLYWMIVVIIVSIFRFIMFKKYEKKERDEKDVIWWGWFFALTAFISGCIWGATSFLFLQTDSLVIMLFLLMTLTGITVGSSASLSNFANSYYAFAIPTILPFAYVLAATGKSDFIVLSLMLTVFLLLQLVVARKNQTTLDESIILRNEKSDLIKQLELKKEKAELANSAKTRFLAAASHDLRQPLHAISLFLDILDERNQDPEQSMIVEKIKKSSLSLENLLESLLDISKLDAGVISINNEPFSIQQLFDAMENEFHPIAIEKGLSIRFMPTSLSLNSDKQNVERILRNLISNAIRYTEQGRILIGCRRFTNSVLLSVYDTGIGIEENKNEIIFEEFQQLDNPGRDRSKGIGLGLSIVNRLAKLLNTEVTLKSIPNKGSVFSIKLSRNLNKQIIQTNNFAFEPNTELSGKFIVVIDDDDEIRNALKLLLVSWGCEVQELISIREVKQKLQPLHKPSLILADYRLHNNETGVNVIHAIYDYYDDKIPAAIITGDTAPTRLKEAKDSGFQLLHKPVSGGKLRALLNSVLLSK